jgi:hypothetical protein
MRARGIAGEGRFDDFAAVNTRETEVGDDDVECEAVDGFEGGLAISRLDNLKAFVRKSFSYNTSERFLIVYEKQVRHRLSKY